MCLTRIRNRLAKKYEGQTWGWKVFRIRGSGLANMFQGELVNLPVGKWLKEEDYRLEGLRGQKYIYGDWYSIRYFFGFHVFLHEGAADFYAGRDFIVRKVKFRNPVAWGTQNGHPVVVAKEMKILPQ